MQHAVPVWKKAVSRVEGGKFMQCKSLTNSMGVEGGCAGFRYYSGSC